MEVIALKWKYIIRRGVPMNSFKIIILDIFKLLYCNNELDYKEASKQMYLRLIYLIIVLN